jgi:uncharacterized protein (DUF3084 family)
MFLRKLIREEVYRILSEQDDNPTMDVFANISQQIGGDIENLSKIITTQSQDVKNADNEFKANSQLKSKLNQGNPQKVGLERELPAKQKDIETRKKQLKDLEKAKKGLEQAQGEIEKQKIELEKMKKTKSGEEGPTSILPSHESPI